MQLRNEDGIDITDCHLLGWLFYFCNSANPRLEKTADGTWVSYPHLAEEMPLLGLGSTGIGNRLLQLQKLGYISVTTNKGKRKTYVKMLLKTEHLFMEIPNHRRGLAEIPNHDGGLAENTHQGSPNHDGGPISNTNSTTIKINKKAAHAAQPKQLSLTGSSRSDNIQHSPTNQVPPVVSKSTTKQELLSLVEELHKTIKGPITRPLEKPELRVESLRKRLKRYTRTELLLAAKNLSHDAWFSGEGKKHQTVDFLLQGNRNQASGDNILRFIEINDEPTNNKATFYDQVRARYAAKPA